MQPLTIQKRNQRDHNYANIQAIRLDLLIGLVIIAAIGLIIRLGYLQLIDYARYETLSRKNQMSILPLPPPRGIILDRNGIILADNIPVYMLEIIRERVPNLTRTILALRKLLPSITEEDLNTFNKISKQSRAFIPVPLKFKLTTKEVERFASQQHHFKGVNIKAYLMRHYPLGYQTAHVLGYVGRINVEELNHVDSTKYNGTNFIGKTGIEYYYEDQLHGGVGYQQLETDVNGRALRTLSKHSPQAGKTLYLSLDMRLQQAAYDALAGKRGAVRS